MTPSRSARSDADRSATTGPRTSLLFSGLRWRARSSVALLLIAAFAAGSGAFGPMYLHGTDQVVVNGALGASSRPNTGLTVVEESGHGLTGRLLADLRGMPRPPAGPRWYGAPIVTEFAAFDTATTSVPSAPGGVHTARTTFTFVPRAGKRLYTATLVTRTGECAHLHIVAGTCHVGTGGVVISVRDAEALGLGLGQPIDAGFIGSTRRAALVVEGVYAVRGIHAPYWWSQDYFPFGVFSAASAYEHLDDAFTNPATIHHIVPRHIVYPVLQVPFDTRSLSVGQVGAFQAALAAFEASSNHKGIRVGTRIGTVLAAAAHTEHVVADIVDVVVLELVVLALFVLYFMSARTAEEREPDVRLAELRGYAVRGSVSVALAEPVVVVVVAVPVGFFGAWGAGALASPALFGAGITVAPAVASVVAAVLAGAVGVLAAALGARRSLVAGADGLPAAVGGFAGGSRWAPLVDSVVVASAVAAFVDLVIAGDSGRAPHPLAALAPGLLAVAVGVLASRALPQALRVVHRWTAHRPGVPVALATRVVARRREFGAQLVVVTVAVALASFAGCGWAIATANRTARAAFLVGAPTVLKVAVAPGTTLLRAVRAAGPGAMAAVIERSHDGTTLALDARRLTSVATWPATLGLSAQAAARRLVPRHLAPEVTLKGTRVRVVADVEGSVTPAPTLTMDLFNHGTLTPEQVTFGRVVPGLHAYRGSMRFLCPGGCRLVDLALSWSPPPTLDRSGADATVSLHVRSLAEGAGRGGWRTLDAGLGSVTRWTSTSGGVQLRAARGALDALVRLNPDGTPTTVAPNDVPHGLPVVVTPPTDTSGSGDGGPLVAGLDGGTVSGHTVGVVAALPGVGGDAVLADLGTAELFLSGPFTYEVTEVWLSRHAPATIRHRLAARGVRVVGVETASEAERALAHDGISLAYLLYLMAGAAAALLVVGATAFAMVCAARRRRDELAALRAVGIDRHALGRALVVEQGIVLGVGLVVGVAAGVVPAAVALRSVPEFVTASGGPPLALGLPPLVLLAVAGSLVAVFVAIALWHAWAVVRRTGAERLGASQT